MKRNGLERLPALYERFEEVNLKTDGKLRFRLNVWSLLMVVPFLPILFLLGFSIDMPQYFMMLLLMGIVIVCHEWIHGVFFQRHYPGKVRYQFHGFAFSASMAGRFFYKREYLIIGLAPAAILNPLLLIAVLLVPTEWKGIAFVLFILHFSACVADFYVAWRMRKFAADVLAEDTGVGMTFYRPAADEMTFKFNLLRQRYAESGFPARDVVLAGSSFMEGWTTSQSDLAPLRTANVGIGGTRVEHWMNWVDTLLVPFHPRAVLLYVGSNNIHGGDDSEQGEDVARKVLGLIDVILKKIPATRLYYVSISPSIARNHVWGEAQRCNELVAAGRLTRPRLSFIDCTSALLNTDGSLRPDIYGEDGLHYTPAGYVIWKHTIAPILIAEMATDRS
jgi:lysophospholipase L1-like esterase